MNYHNYNALAVEQNDAVLTVQLNRPQMFNAIDGQLHSELASIFSDIAADESVDAVVLTGAGQAFSAGGDLNWLRNISSSELDILFIEAKKIIYDLVDLPQPIIAAINGPAAGLGATLALFCDVVYMSEAAIIADPHVRIGVTAGDGGAVIWPLLLGPARAKEYLLTGDSLTAAQAERIGLINKVLSRELVLSSAESLARRLAQGSRLAIRSTKLAVNKLVRDTVNLVLDTSLALEKECFHTEFHQQALERFAIKAASKPLV